MALRRCTRPVDGTIPVQALLYNDEEIHASQDSVGIYDGYVPSLSSQVDQQRDE
jgi:ESCRT-II complex subunit VPS36